VAWKKYIANPPKQEMIDWWFRGICNMAILVSGTDLLVIDYDQQDHPPLINTFTIKTARGYHQYLWCPDKPPATVAVSRGDVKTTGYVLFPPSIHPKGIAYEVERNAHILTVEWQDVVEIVGEPIGRISPPLSARRISADSIVAKIKNHIDIRKYIPTQLQQVGDSYVGICPWHKDTNPSLQVWPQDGRLYCHSTQCVAHAGGDVIDALVWSYGYTPEQAISYLSQYVE